MHDENVRFGRIDQLTLLLKERCETIVAGERFLSVRQIMTDYNVSQITVNKALARLVEAGVLVARERSGYFIQKRANNLISVIVPSDSKQKKQNSFSEQLNSVKIALQEAKLEYEIIYYDGDNPSGVAKLPETKGSAVFFIPKLADGFSVPMLNRIMAHPVPVIMLFTSPKSTNCRFVDGANEFSGTLAASLLLIKGHKKLAILISEPKIAIVRERVEGFIKTAAAFKIPVEIIDPEIACGEDSVEKSCRFFSEYLDRKKLDITALFVISSDPTKGIIKSIKKHGLKIPDDISVISLGRPENDEINLTTIDTRRYEIARSAVQLLLNYFNRTVDSPNYIVVPPIIHEGSTVKDLHCAK